MPQPDLDGTTPPVPAVGSQPLIEDYGLIGNCLSAALVSSAGSIDWLCWPRFDSPACFAAILGTPDNGFWRIAPEEKDIRISRRYWAGTMILETLFETDSGAVALIDVMALGQPAVIRIVEGRQGCVRMRSDLVLRFAYGSAVPWLEPKDGCVSAIAGPDQVSLHAEVPVQCAAANVTASFQIAAGERTRFVLTYAPSHLPPPSPPHADAALGAADRFWREWSGRCTYEGPYRELVSRSLLTLKALTYQPTGGIVAAPTTSLPEELGGERNWDYRFCWLRDATFTLLALIHAGYREDAIAWGGWLRRSVAGAPEQVQTLYGIAGERMIREWEVPWLAGYGGAKPVRIGNAASDQLQLDVYGELLDALYQEATLGLVAPDANWDLQCVLVRHLEAVWDKPDQSIWEVRGDARHFTFSKVMAWVAFDRAVRCAEMFKLTAPLDHWRAIRAQIHETVCREGFNQQRNTFVQYFGGDAVDASLLLIPLVGFLPPDHPRVLGTVDAVAHDLLVDGLVRRYLTEEEVEGLSGDEGVFLACSFWYVNALAAIGRTDAARTMFERLLMLCNDVGLLAEEYDPKQRRQLGNFPQALSHLALVNAALALGRHTSPVDQRMAGGADDG